jgi:diguanylate cyclase (GGDEF)-like protein
MDPKKHKDTERLRIYILLGAVMWTCIVAASLVWNISQLKHTTITKAEIMAHLSFDKDTSFRMWVNSHGGIYVPITEETKPNPYLSVPGRDIQARNGKWLTLMNPAYVMRQYYESFQKEGTAKGHITSLKPLRPENAPDPWEEISLKSFEQGKEAAITIQKINGTEYVRLMKPFVVTRGCLKCHAAQGYSEGDIRGGVSTSVPMTPLRSLENGTIAAFTRLHIFLWLIGMTGIAIFGHHIVNNEKKRREAEEVMQHMAYHDTLTGLPNRKLFFDRLTMAMAQADRDKENVAIVVFDLDRFKDVNDTYGHDVGDLLLKAYTERLTGVLRKTDTIARFGGDEFVLILPKFKDVHGVSTAADKIIGTCQKPFTLNGHSLCATMSMGISIYPDDGRDADTLLKNADIALYEAKEAGRNRYQFYGHPQARF